MATSETWSFNLTLPEIIEQAYERIGGELRTGYDYKTARQSLDMLLLEWQNLGLHLWTVKNASQTLTSGTASYDLSNEKLDIIDASLRTDAGTTSQRDLSMRRVSVSNYSRQTNKNQTGRPTQYTVQQSPTNLTITVWPVPDGTETYVFNYWYMERIEDTGGSGGNNVDVPARFLPALVAGLAYQMALKTPAAFQMLPMLSQEYDRQFNLAADAAREKASVRLVPKVS